MDNKLIAILEAERNQRAIIDEIFDNLTDAAYAFETAQTVVFKSLVHRVSPTYTVGLKEHQDDFNVTVTTLVNLCIRLGKDNPAIHDAMAQLENNIKIIASDFNEACYQAIGNRDGGKALEALAERTRPAAIDLLRRYVDQLKTDHLDRDTRRARAGVYIGRFCNRVEIEGKKSVKEQWVACWFELKNMPEKLRVGDAAEAWEYFQYKKPFSMTYKKEKREFDQEIDRFKRNAKSSDKVPTSRLNNGL